MRIRGVMVRGAIGACVGLAGIALGQVAPPPPPAPAPTPKYVAPPPPPAPTPPKPIIPKPVKPVVKWEPIPIEKHEDGSLKALPKPLEILAIEHNPLIDQPTKLRIEPALNERRQKFEQAILGNVVSVSELDAGILDTTDLSDREALGKVKAVMDPLENKEGAIDQLEKAGLLTKDQASISKDIWREYQRGAFRVVREHATKAFETKNNTPAPPGIGTKAVTAYLFKQRLDEMGSARNGLLLEAAARFSTVSAGLGADSATTAAIASAPDDAARLDALMKFVSGLTTEKREALYKAIIATR